MIIIVHEVLIDSPDSIDARVESEINDDDDLDNIDDIDHEHD